MTPNSWYKITGTAAALVAISLGLLPSPKTSVNVRILTDTGQPLPSLFFGVSRNNSQDRFVATAKAPEGCRLQQQHGFLSVLDFFSVKSVYAVECVSGECYDHWQLVSAQDCPGMNHCQDAGPQYERFTQDLAGAFFSDGYKFTGSVACAGCRCEQEHCTH